MRKGLTWALIALLLLVGGAPESALANTGGGGAYQDADSNCKQIRQQIASEDSDGVYLIESIVTCIKAVIAGDDKYGVTGVFEIFLQEIYDFFAPIIQIALTLSVLLFGVLMVTGMLEKPARDGFMALIKIACVVYFVQTSTAQWVFDSSLSALDDLTEMVFTFGQTGEAEGRCKVQSEDTLWDRVDCMMDVLIGIHKTQDGMASSKPPKVSPDKEGISRGMMHFFFSNLNSGGMGAVIGLLGMYTVFTFVFAVIKSIHTYLAAVLGLAFILVLIPMFVPFFLFKSTRNYFDKWYRIALSFILQPVILFGFLSLMMVALDTMLVSGDNSVLKMIGGTEAGQKVISEILEEKGVYEENRLFQQGTILSRASSVTSKLDTKLKGAADGTMATAVGTTLLGKDGTMEGVNMSYLPVDAINYETLGGVMKGAGDDTKAKEQLAYAAIIMALTCFVFLSMLNYIPTMATDLAGGVFEVPNLYENVGQKFLGADQFEGMAHQFSRSARRQMKGLVGLR